MPSGPHISTATFVEILQNDKLVRKDEVLIFQTLHALAAREASATELARLLGWRGKNDVQNKILGLGRRILQKYDIQQSKRTNGTKRYWDLFFTGRYEGVYFLYRLKPELEAALAECGLLRNISLPISRPAYLFAWNPAKWQWADLEQQVEEWQKTGKSTQVWSCVSHRRIRPGDRVFLVRLGSTPRGIMASGKVVSEPFTAPHWNGEDREIWKVVIEFDVLLNPGRDSILTLEFLDTGALAKQQWTPMSSGVPILPEAAQELEEEWFHFLTTQQLRFPPFADASQHGSQLYEGAAIETVQTRYERNTYARNLCLEHYGYACAACEFDFEKTYGSLGHKFIHVHHRTMISTAGQPYQVDPVKDLVPVCPNCHAMLHRQNPPLTVDELKHRMARD
ncbi:EVE domain-containing protein [Hymenobacter busanensis]|uniref:EVE domain-containing protein n=1 Tax=Hymenobacter busanensis TaxID=2607656 RepID=A0A7L4ZSZ1_9BACT|nr:EVE domain-containing protein [Hymenobacter busanensis]KAA9327229.1 EVE domain-containing protein [Hymenobacter busanensis]QHJ05895.1 EVE domain-containing protein [Hymenobacter busanensis]